MSALAIIVVGVVSLAGMAIILLMTWLLFGGSEHDD
jgi:hypothetical protein